MAETVMAEAVMEETAMVEIKGKINYFDSQLII